MGRRPGLMLLLEEAGTGKTAARRAFAQCLNPSVYKTFYATIVFDMLESVLALQGGNERSRST